MQCSSGNVLLQLCQQRMSQFLNTFLSFEVLTLYRTLGTVFTVVIVKFRADVRDSLDVHDTGVLEVGGHGAERVSGCGRLDPKHSCLMATCILIY